MAKDIKILFGVEGGGSVNGASGQRILQELNQIASDISAKSPPKVMLELDENATQSRLQKQLDAIVAKLGTRTPGNGSGNGSNPIAKQLGLDQDSELLRQAQRIEAAFARVTGSASKVRLTASNGGIKAIVSTMDGAYRRTIDFNTAIKASDTALRRMLKNVDSYDIDKRQQAVNRQISDMRERVELFSSDPAYANIVQLLDRAQAAADKFFSGGSQNSSGMTQALNRVRTAVEGIVTAQDQLATSLGLQDGAQLASKIASAQQAFNGIYGTDSNATVNGSDVIIRSLNGQQQAIISLGDVAKATRQQLAMMIETGKSLETLDFEKALPSLQKDVDKQLDTMSKQVDLFQSASDYNAIKNEIDGARVAFEQFATGAVKDVGIYEAVLENTRIAVDDFLQSQQALAGSLGFKDASAMASKIASAQQAFNGLNRTNSTVTMNENGVDSTVTIESINGQIKATLQLGDVAQATRQQMIRMLETGKSLDTLNLEKNQLKTNKLYSNAQAFYDRYSDALSKMPELNARWQEFLASAASGEKDVAELANEFTKLESATLSAGGGVETFGEKLTSQFKSIAQSQAISKLINAVSTQAKQLISTSAEIDKKMTDLQIVTKATSHEMSEQFDAAAKAAHNAGTAITDLIDSQTVYARLGYSMQESSALAEYTAMLSKVGDIDVGDAQNAVTAIVKAFDVDASDVQSVMDMLVEVGNNFPISVSQLAEGMNNAGSMMKSAGNSIEETMGLLTAANTTVQNISKSSTGLRTIAARIRNTKSELDELGETMVIADYEKAVSTLSGAGVKFMDNGEFRSTYEILKDIADVWDQISSANQAAIAETLAGTRQQNVFASIIEQFQEASGAVKAAQDADGKMAEAYDVYLNSVEGRVGRIKATYESIAHNVANSTLLSMVLAIGDGLLQILNTLSKVHALIPGIAGAVANLFGKGVQNIGWIQDKIQKNSLLSSIPGLSTTGKDPVVELSKLAQKLSGFKGSFLTINESITKYNSLLGGSVDEQNAFFDSIRDANPHLYEYLQSLNGAQGDLQGYVAQLKAVEAEQRAATVTSTLLNAAISMGIGALLSLGYKLIDNLIHRSERIQEAAENARQEIDSISSDLKSNIQTINDAADAYARLAQGVDQVTGRNKTLSDDDYAQFIEYSNQIAEIAPELVAYYDAQGNAVLNLAGDYETLTRSIHAFAEILVGNAQEKIAKQLPAIFKGAKESASDLQALYNHLDDFKDAVNTSNGLIGANTTSFDFLSEYTDLADQLGISWGYVEQAMDDGTTGFVVKFNESTNDVIATIDSRMNDVSDEIKQSYSGVKKSMSAWLVTNDVYVTMSDQMRDIINAIVGNLDYASLDFKNSKQATKWIEDNLFNIELDENTIDLFVNVQTQMNDSSTTVAEFESNVSMLITKLRAIGASEEVVKTIRVMFNVDENGGFNNSNNIIDDVADKTGKSKFGVGLTLRSMSTAQYAAFEDFWSGYEVTAGTTFDDVIRDFKKHLAEMQAASSGFNISFYTDQIDKVRSSIDTLKKALVSSGDLDAGDLLDLFENYPKLLDEVADGNTDLSDAIQDIIDKQVEQIAETLRSSESYEENKDQIEALIRTLEDYAEVSRDLNEYQSRDKAAADAFDEVKKKGSIALDTLVAIKEQYPELADAVSQYQAGLITEQGLLDQISQAQIAYAQKYAMAELEKMDLTGKSASEVQAIYTNLMASLGVAYSGDSAAFAALINSKMNNSAKGARQVAAHWNAVTSAIARSSTDTARKLNGFKGVFEDPASLKKVQNFQDVLTSLAYAKPIEGNYSYKPVTPVSSKGSGGGNSASKEKTAHDIYDDAVDALKSQIEWYKYQAETAESMFKFDDASTNWQKVLELYKKMADAAKAEMDRLAATGVTFGDKDYDAAVDDFKEATKAIRDVYEDLLDKMFDQYKDYIDALDDFSLFGGDTGYQLKLIQEMLDHLEDAYSHDLISTEKYIEEKTDILKDYYDAYQDYIDAVADAMDKSIDKEKDALEEQQDELEKSQDRYKTMIDVVSELIDKQIDALDDENDELERQVKLEEALRDLEEAKRQRTAHIYREGIGFVWEADANAVREAQDAYDELVRETTKDDATKRLESLKDALDNIMNAYENQKNNDITTGILGEGWEDRWSDAMKAIIAGGADGDAALDALMKDIKAYTDAYSETSKDLDEDVDGSIASQIKALDDLSDAWKDFADSLKDESSQYEGLLDYIKEFENASYEDRLKMLEDFSKNAVDELEKIREKAKETTDQMSKVGGDTLYEQITTDYTKKNQPSGGSSSESGSSGSSPGSSASSTASQWSDLPGLSYVYYGSASNKVRRLQEALSAAGYGSYLGKSGVDGIFGKNTYRAVLAFQQAAGIGADGQAGPVTLNALMKKLSSYAKGGVIDFTGIAAVHGGRAAELMLNNADVAKVYDYIHNTPNLIADMIQRVVKAPSFFPSIGAVGGTTVNISIGDLNEVNSAQDLADEITKHLPRLILQRAY